MEVIGCVYVSADKLRMRSDKNHVLNGPPSVGRLEKETSKSTPTPLAPLIALMLPLTLPLSDPEVKKEFSGSTATASFPRGLFVTVIASPSFYWRELVE